jgi:hypothetical protein
LLRLPQFRFLEDRAAVKSVLNVSPSLEVKLASPHGHFGPTTCSSSTRVQVLSSPLVQEEKIVTHPVGKAMDDEDQPVNAEIGSATQVVDFATIGEVAQNGNVPDSEFASEPQEQAQSLPVDSRLTSGEPENREESRPSDNHIALIQTQAGVTHSLQDLNTQHLPNESLANSEILDGGDARLNSDDEVPPDELPPAEKGKDAEVIVPSRGPASREEEAEALSSPVELLRVPSPVPAVIGGPIEAPAPRKRRLPVGILPWRFGDAPGRKTVELKKIGLKQDDQKKESKTDDQKEDIQKKEQKKDGQKKEDPKEPEVSQKALGGNERRETEKAPAAVSTVKHCDSLRPLIDHRILGRPSASLKSCQQLWQKTWPLTLSLSTILTKLLTLLGLSFPMPPP